MWCAGLVGLAISYVLSMTGLLNGVVTYFTETEKQMVSVERIDQYISDIPEEYQTESIQVSQFDTKYVTYAQNLTDSWQN